MIGNDIVDLKYAAYQSNTTRYGWVEKLFTKKEQKVICNAQYREQTIWLLWSKKEATYKAHHRRFQLPPTFNPIAYDASGNCVVIGKNIYHTNSLITRTYIHTVAYDKDSSVHKNNISILLNTTVSGFLDHISAKLGYSRRFLSIRKNEIGIPYIYLQHKKLLLLYSISHHGEYNAFIYL